MLALSLTKIIFVNAFLAVTLSTTECCSCSDLAFFLYYLCYGYVRVRI